MTKYKSYKDCRGELIPIEFDSLPFEPKRIFVVQDVPIGFRRGFHAHFKNQQFLICLKGKIRVGIHDGLALKEKILRSKESILIKNLEWDYQDFLEKKSILLVICSTNFNKKDYILNFKKFTRLKKNAHNRI